MKRTAAIVILFAALATLARAQDTNFGVRVPCEMQATSGESEPRLATLTWLQGTTPLVVAEPLRRGRAIPHDADTRVRMVIGPSATGTLYAVRTNAAAVTNGYAVQWPTIGTNTAGAAWFYTILFDKDGRTYWTGSGDLYITATTSTASNGLDWIEYTIPSVGWGDIAGDPADNSALAAYVAEHSGGSAEDTVARNMAASNAASILAVGAVASGAVQEASAGYTTAVAQAAAAYGWGNHGAAGYATGTPVYVETDPIFSATNAWLVRTNDSAYTATVANAASAVQPADTNGWVVSSHSGLATEAQAGQIATNVASGYLPLAGHNGPVVLGTSIRGYGATTNVGPYGFAAGEETSAGYAGFAAGVETSAGYAGFAAGSGTSAGYAGFAAGAAARGANGSFVFADNSTGGTHFNRTNIPNSFSLRVAGGIYALIGTNVFAVSNAVTMNGVELGAGGGSGISAADAGTIATNVVAAYTNAMPLPGCAILPVDPATSNAWIGSSGLYGFYTVTNATTPWNLCISNTQYRSPYGYGIKVVSTQAITAATNMVRVGAAPSALTATNLIAVWPHEDPALWNYKVQAQ